jgi:lysozyme
MKKLTSVVCSVMAIISIVVGYSPSADIDKNAKPIGQVVIGNVAVGELTVSNNALLVVGNAEGCRREPYKCPAGLDTDGIGNTHGVARHKSDQQIAIDWTKNIITAESCLYSSTSKKMTQGQVDAFTSFIFNTGCTRFKKNRNGSDTRIYKFIRAGQFDAACRELKGWVWGGGKKLPGLVARRELETTLCFLD